MKFIYFTIFILSFTLGGCSKYLEVDPKNRRALETVKDVKTVLAGYLKVMKPGEAVTYHTTIDQVIYMLPSYWSLFEYHSDNIDFKRDLNLYLNASGTNGIPNMARLVLMNNFDIPTKIWVSHYKAIGFMNVLLDVLDKAKGDELEKAQLRNEIIVSRSIYYFKLFQYFSPYTEMQNGIPIYTGAEGPFAGLATPRSSQSEVFKFLIAQLQEVATSTATPDGAYNIFFNKRFVNNLLAQIYWYKAESAAKEAGDYAQAKLYARAAIEGVNFPKTATEYIAAINGELLNYPVYQRWGGNTTLFPEYIYGQPFGDTKFSPHASPELLAIFSTDDYRYKAYIKPDQTIVRPMKTSPGNYTAAAIMFRPEEAYLINIEATLKDQQGGSEAEARNLLNAFRTMRGLTTDFTGADLNQEIINERRREFCFHSDLRWIDMKRFGLGNSRTDLTILGNNYSVDVQPNGYQYALPIPVEEELNLNPAMTPNPFWNVINF